MVPGARETQGRAESPARSQQLSRERLMRLGHCQEQLQEIYMALGSTIDQERCEWGVQTGIERVQHFAQKGA